MLIIQIPDRMADEDACTLGVGITTVGQGLYQSLGLPLPGSGARATFPIFIYGGSTATGSLAIQHERLSRCSQIITTCSPRYSHWVKSLGADASFDYRNPDCVQKIKDFTQDALAHALDCVSTSASAELCAAVTGSNGGPVSYLLPLKHEREDFEARPEDLEFSKIFWKLSAGLVAEGKIQFHLPQVGKDGSRKVGNWILNMYGYEVDHKQSIEILRAPIDQNTTSKLDVAIISSGIAGVTLALGLLKCRSFCKIGAGIGSTPTEWAMNVLDPEIHAAFKRVMVQNGTDWLIWVDKSLEKEAVVHKIYLSKRGFESCVQADFLDKLVKSLPRGTVQFSKNLVEIMDEDGASEVRLKFSDRGTASAHVIIGCDRIRSKVRQFKAYAALGQEMTENRHMYLGPDTHALTFPVAGGKLLNVISFVTDPSSWLDSEKFTLPASKTNTVKAFEQINSTVRAIINMLPEELSRWTVFNTYDYLALIFVRGCVCISRDTAHIAAPYHGAGAGFAVEDAAVLAQLLSDMYDYFKIHDIKKGDILKSVVLHKALKTYNSICLERAHWLVVTSRHIGEIYEGQNADIGLDHTKCAAEIDWRCRKIWHYDVDEIMRQTSMLLKKQLGIV
ncbi:hypothetical protein BDV23DRAFT_171895 [Aspergillus alliaceus]|uniref:FAD-binding domain-containing protein n=1 Tax=Petromyces alliaceus TaxID=209559 RepID=A0A5N7CAI3_PETAA|nr:hypothetical protein BDV23DRAFT_171895 [Aspergillus alliaceus]